MSNTPQLSTAARSTKIEVQLPNANSRHEYELSWDSSNLPGDWSKAKSSIDVVFVNGKFLRVCGWVFPTSFYGTREYFKLMALIDAEISRIEFTLMVKESSKN